MKFIELYPPDNDNELIHTSQGVMRYRDFLAYEKKRIEQNPKRVAILKSRLGFSWLLVNKVTVPRQNNGQSWRHYMPAGQRKVQSIHQKIIR